MMGRGADFRRLQDHTVAAGERGGDRAHAKDHRGVPRRHAEDDAGRLPDRERNHARLVGGDDLAHDLGRQAGGLAQHAGGEMDVETGPGRRRADFLDHRLGEFARPRLEEIGGLEQERPPFARTGLRPGGKGPRRGLDHLGDVGFARRRSFARHRAGDRIATGVGGAGGGWSGRAVDDEIYLH